MSFACPWCREHHFGSVRMEDGTYRRYCNGHTVNGERCRFCWPEADDAKYGLEPPAEVEAVGQHLPGAMDMNYDVLVSLRASPSSAPALFESATIEPAPDLPLPLPTVTIQVEEEEVMPMPTPIKAVPASDGASAPEALDVFFEFCDKVEEVCPRPRSAQGRVRWREIVKELYLLAKEES